MSSCAIAIVCAPISICIMIQAVTSSSKLLMTFFSSNLSRRAILFAPFAPSFNSASSSCKFFREGRARRDNCSRYLYCSGVEFQLQLQEFCKPIPRCFFCFWRQWGCQEGIFCFNSFDFFCAHVDCSHEVGDTSPVICGIFAGLLKV